MGLGTSSEIARPLFTQGAHMGYQKKVKLQHKFQWEVGGVGVDSSTVTGVIPIFSAPAGCLITSAKAYVQTAVTGSTAEELGDGTDVDGYLVDNFAASTGIYPTSVNDATCGVFMKVDGATDAADAAPEVKLYASADTIDFKITGTATAGKILFLIDFEVLA